MNEDEKMFQVGLWAFGGVILLTTVLGVCYRTQGQARNHIRNEIIKTQQDIATADVTFSSLKKSEILRNLVTYNCPGAELIGFHKTVSIADLKDRN